MLTQLCGWVLICVVGICKATTELNYLFQSFLITVLWNTEIVNFVVLLEMEKKFTWVSPSVFFSSCILTFINYQGKLNANFNMTCVFNKSKENLKMKN